MSEPTRAAAGGRTIQLMRPNIDATAIDLLREVLESGNLVEGTFVHELEGAVAAFTGAKHALACTSATTGLELALRALGVGQGDEVIVPDFTHPATALAVQTVGAEPVLVDVDLESRNTTAALMAGAITPRTRALMPVSLFGHPLDMDPIVALAKAHALPVIEDSACSLGSSYQGRKVGSLADFSVFSFHPRKLFASGDGGLVTTDDDRWAAAIESIKHFGIGTDTAGAPAFVRWGSNYRMTELQGAVLVSQVRRINEILEERAAKARVYDDLLQAVPGVRSPQIRFGSSNYQTYAVRLERDGVRDRVMQALKARGVQTQIGTFAVHLQPAFQATRRHGTLETSALLHRQLLTLPLHHRLAFDDQAFVVTQLADVLRAL